MNSIAVAILVLVFSISAHGQGGFFQLPLAIQDSTGRTDTIQFGINNLATRCIDSALGEEEIPPDACCNWFNILCIRFTTPYPYDSMGNCLGQGVRLDLRDFRSDQQVDTFRVEFCGTSPWVLRWPPLLHGWVDSAVLQDQFGGIFHSVNMLETDSIVVTNPLLSSLALIIARPTFMSDVGLRPISVPLRRSLIQNYPNPFNSTTTIEYELPIRSHVTIRVFDLLGREVAFLFDGLAEPGTNSLRFDAGGLGSGVYICRLSINGSTESRNLVIQK